MLSQFGVNSTSYGHWQLPQDIAFAQFDKSRPLSSFAIAN